MIVQSELPNTTTSDPKRFQIRTSNVMMAMLCVAIILAWQRDRARLVNHYERIINPRPSWGNCQAEGPPDTPGAGDLTTAWASKTPDGQVEWLIAEYSHPLCPTAIEVHETFNPGAITKVTGLDKLGVETILWEGVENVPANAKRHVAIFDVATNQRFRRIKVYLDSPNHPGWNEIDAMGLQTKSTTHWAQRVTSSSSFANERVYQFGPVQIAR